MNFHEFGDKNLPHIMLIHGGGNAWWNYLRQARALSLCYHVILPTLDGHGEEYQIDYISTEDSAKKIIEYINTNCGGYLFGLCGVSLGGQIVIEILSQKPDITKKVIIDGSICYPQPMMAKYCITMINIFFKMMFSEISCKWQISFLNRFMPKFRFTQEISNYYIQDMPKIRKDTLITMYHTYMGSYHIKDSIKNTTADIIYCYGSREMKCVKKSAKMFKNLVSSCKIFEAKGYNHGYLAIYFPDEWIKIFKKFLDS